jgi:DNA (cytosine-5)-methyltransferase 1
MIADDLFAGAGGWDLAAAKLGIHARGVENMKEARATRDAAGLTTIHDDVWTFAPDGNAEGLIASPPCQTFSAAGKGSGRKALDDVLGAIWSDAHMSLDHLRDVGEKVGDDRTALVLTPLHFAMTGGYDWLAWEQVPTVLPVWQACAEVLRANGWKAWAGLSQAEMYGVPQTRKRAFLIASRNGITAAPPTHSRYYSRSPEKLDPGVQKWVSMAEALGGAIADGQARNSGPGAAREPRSIDHPSYTIRAQGSGSHPSGVEWVLWSSPSGITGPVVRSIDHPAATVTGADNHYVFTPEEWATRNHDRPLPTWAFNRPSTTIVGSFKPEIVAAPGYRTTVSRQNAPNSVRVTVEEAGVLQSFPADYPWQGAKGKQFLQCGNAVPPGLALHALAAASGIKAEEVAA